jgi:cytoskeleton protein RodZ
MSETAQALGQRLKAAREQRGVSAQRMADDMHLDAWVIEALESGDYGRIGPTVYAQGYLKKYVSLLGLSTTPPEAQPVLSRPPAPIPIVRIDPPSRVEWPKVGGVAAVVLAAGGVAWWRPWHREAAQAPTASAVQPSAPIPAPETPAGEPGAGMATSTPSDAEVADAQAAASDDATPLYESGAPPLVAPPPAASGTPPKVASGAPPKVASNTVPPAAQTSAPAPARTATVAPAPSASITPGVGRARLRLSFSADSRVDVFDYSGKAIFTGNGRANSVKVLAGTAPFHVYIGSASGVQVEVNDRAVAIGRQFVTGDVARFEAGADGVLRRDTRANSTNGSQTIAASPRG